VEAGNGSSWDARATRDEPREGADVPLVEIKSDMKMRNTSSWERLRHLDAVALLCAVALTMASLVCFAGPAIAEQVSLLNGRCTVAVPAGWRVDDTFGDDGLLLHPPDPRVWPVELVVWAIPDGGAETAKAAALAHEAVIRQSYPYTRKEQSEFATATTKGLQIIGQVKTPDGVIISCLFVALASAGRYYTVGTFCLPDQVEAVNAQYLQPVAQNLSIGPPRTGESSTREHRPSVKPKPVSPKPTPASETKPDSATTGTVSGPHVPRPGETEIRDQEPLTETAAPPLVAETIQPVVRTSHDDTSSEPPATPGTGSDGLEVRVGRITMPAGTLIDDSHIAPPKETVTIADDAAVVAPATKSPVQPEYDHGAVAHSATPALRTADTGLREARTTRPVPAIPEGSVDARATTLLPAKPRTERDDGRTLAPTSKPVVGPEERRLQHLSSAYLELEAPPEFQIDAIDGKWLVHPGGSEGEKTGLLIWPLIRYDSSSSAPQIARAALQHWSVSANQYFEFRTQTDGESAIFFGNGTTAAGAVRLLGSITMQGNVAMLTALYVAPENAAAEWPLLVQMLASVKVSALPIRTPLQAPPSYQWEMPGYPGLTVPIPEGWLVRGRLTNEPDGWALCIEAATRGSQRYYMSWQQPVKPLFHELTPVLEDMGWKRLDRYGNQPNGQTHVLLSKTGPAEFVGQYWNAKTRVPVDGVEIVRQQESRMVKGLLNTQYADGLQMVVEGDSLVGARHNHYLVAVGDAEQDGQQTWQAAILEASGPAEYPDHAVAALRNMIQGASAPAGQEAGEADLRAMIQRAKEAVTLLPPVLSDRMQGIESALNLLSDDEGETWRPPTASGRTWKQLIAPDIMLTDAENIVPEIGKLRQ